MSTIRAQRSPILQIFPSLNNLIPTNVASDNYNTSEVISDICTYKCTINGNIQQPSLSECKKTKE